MLLTRCSNGHFFDKHKYDTCPCCDGNIVLTNTTATNVQCIEKCENGHCFDKNIFDSCPHCKSPEANENEVPIGVNFQTPLYWESLNSEEMAKKYRVTVEEDIDIGDIVKLKGTGQIVEIVKKNWNFNDNWEPAEFCGKLINADDESFLLFSKRSIMKKYNSIAKKLLKLRK